VKSFAPRRRAFDFGPRATQLAFLSFAGAFFAPFAKRERATRAILALAIGALSFALPAHAAALHESIPQRLLRTIQIGAPQDLTVDQIKKIAASQQTEYTTSILARSALLVLHQDKPGLIPYNELFDSVLNHLVRDGNAFQPPPGLPDFRGKETVFTMTYAMVMSGQQEQAVTLLGPHLWNGSEYKHAVVLSALRNIGTQSAIGLIQQYAEKGPDRNLGENTLADEDYPVLSDVYARWNMIPPAQRTQDNLRTLVQSGCNDRGVMAAYWLGFFPKNIDPNKQVAEIQALEALVHTNSGSCEMMEHVIALKSLALRAARSPAYWQRLASQTTNVWEQHQIVINAWGSWGAKFAPAALDMLATAPAQYVQWELLDGNLDTRMGEKYRTYWDIWMPANIILVQKEDEVLRAPGPESMNETNINILLSWLESGKRPQDQWVWNHLIYHLGDFVSGDDTFRLLRLFNALPQRDQSWWILQTLRDPAALPILRYWATLPSPSAADKSQQQMLLGVITRLQNAAAHPPFGAKSAACCGPTEDCLRQQLSAAAIASPANAVPPSVGASGAAVPSANPPVTSAAPSASATLEIHSEQEARAWLAQKSAPPAAFAIRFTDDLHRSATVSRTGSPDQHWQYLYDCWRNVDGTATASAASSVPAKP
jgi:hypothetical protein